MGFGMENGYVWKADSIESLAAAAGLANLTDAVNRYRELVAAGDCVAVPVFFQKNYRSTEKADPGVRGLYCSGDPVPNYRAINILPHADCFVVFVKQFGILDKAVFLIKGKYAFIVFYVGINGEETDGAIIVITG
jgi:hypothetical protein